MNFQNAKNTIVNSSSNKQGFYDCDSALDDLNSLCNDYTINSCEEDVAIPSNCSQNPSEVAKQSFLKDNKTKYHLKISSIESGGQIKDDTHASSYVPLYIQYVTKDKK